MGFPNWLNTSKLFKICIKTHNQVISCKCIFSNLIMNVTFECNLE